MQWNDSHKNPPKSGDTVYYFGPNIGLWLGTYQYKVNGITHHKTGEFMELCPHLYFPKDGHGVVDACDAPFWYPYDAEREDQGWRPIIPECYTKDLYEEKT